MCWKSKFLIQSPCLTVILLTWRIWWTTNNTSKWQIGFNWAFKVLNSTEKKTQTFRAKTFRPYYLFFCSPSHSTVSRGLDVACGPLSEPLITPSNIQQEMHFLCILGWGTRRLAGVEGWGVRLLLWSCNSQNSRRMRPAERLWYQQYETCRFINQNMYKVKGKDKVHRCTGTEALYRPYGL